MIVGNTTTSVNCSPGQFVDVRIVNPQSNLCLSVPGSDPTNGNQLVLLDCTGGANQRWSQPS
ncbi:MULTISPECIES: RICIN domain-containing protein [Kitasatospora]|uniref:RICIN domain-containing protein n=1 Tax=Kitasatospora TaxID=2063 RepID=UPI0004C0BC95|nr:MULTISPECIES: RICIN domain-containing protein [Kitasatospora]